MRSEYVVVYEVDGEQSLSLARRALPEIPYDLFSVRGLLFIMLDYGYLMLGKPERGFEIIYEALRTARTETGSQVILKAWSRRGTVRKHRLCSLFPGFPLPSGRGG
jgi:hypothetical protein